MRTYIFCCFHTFSNHARGCPLPLNFRLVFESRQPRAALPLQQRRERSNLSAALDALLNCFRVCDVSFRVCDVSFRVSDVAETRLQ